MPKLPPTEIGKRYPRVRQWALWLFWASGWIASVFLGLLDLPEKIVSFAKNAPEAREVTGNMIFDYRQYEGSFSSDAEAWTERNLLSDGTPQVDSGQVQLALEYEGNGAYHGEINSIYMAEHSLAPWSRIMVKGEINAFGTFEGTVWDIVSNQRSTYGEFTLKVEDPEVGTLRLTPTRGRGIFPGELILWPTDFVMGDGVRGKQFDAALLKIAQRNRSRGTEPDSVRAPVDRE